MDTLLNNIRNEVTSYQHFISKFKNSKTDELISNLNDLKNTANATDNNMDKILKIEKKLENLADEEISAKLLDSPLYEHLHNEKMSPVFLKLAKISSSEAKLSDIKNNNGGNFDNSS
jgi:hypothetical protein